jgi:hypothetical protein
MNRRSFFRRLAAIPFLAVLWRKSATSTQAAVKSASSSARCVRPSDALWPTEEGWKKLKQDVRGQLIRVESPLAACASGPDSTSCQEVIKSLQNPYYAGSYVSESNFFEPNWQQSFWGRNYPSLRAVKAKYDPEGLFFVHHGVGSEDWSADGFVRLT